MFVDRVMEDRMSDEIGEGLEFEGEWADDDDDDD